MRFRSTSPASLVYRLRGHAGAARGLDAPAQSRRFPSVRSDVFRCPRHFGAGDGCAAHGGRSGGDGSPAPAHDQAHVADVLGVPCRRPAAASPCACVAGAGAFGRRVDRARGRSRMGDGRCGNGDLPPAAPRYRPLRDGRLRRRLHGCRGRMEAPRGGRSYCVFHRAARRAHDRAAGCTRRLRGDRARRGAARFLRHATCDVSAPDQPSVREHARVQARVRIRASVRRERRESCCRLARCPGCSRCRARARCMARIAPRGRCAAGTRAWPEAMGCLREHGGPDRDGGPALLDAAAACPPRASAPRCSRREACYSSSCRGRHS